MYNLCEQSQRKLQIIGIFLCSRGATLMKIALPIFIPNFISVCVTSGKKMNRNCLHADWPTGRLTKRETNRQQQSNMPPPPHIMFVTKLKPTHNS